MLPRSLSAVLKSSASKPRVSDLVFFRVSSLDMGSRSGCARRPVAMRSSSCLCYAQSRSAGPRVAAHSVRICLRPVGVGELPLSRALGVKNQSGFNSTSNATSSSIQPRISCSSCDARQTSFKPLAMMGGIIFRTTSQCCFCRNRSTVFDVEFE